MARFRVAVNAVIERDGRYLLARRRDIGWWHLVGGGLEYGETIQQGLLREVREEIGVSIDILRLVGVYAKPQKQEVVLTFLCSLPADTAEPKTSEEIVEIGWFATDQLPQPLLPKHRERLLDAAADRREAVVKAQTTSTEKDQGGSSGSQMARPADG
jgi:ADP-ribose pyrophosphatase YjhB (NUDIX family)